MFRDIKNSILIKSENKYKIDLHSHFIPEIDDGCSSINESLALIKQMKKLGFKKLITTPHIMSHKYPNNINIIKEGLFELRANLKVQNIDIEIEASAEYYCDKLFLSLIEKKELFCFGKNYVLFELPYTTRPDFLEQCIQKMLRLNYKPVLAHPERYRFLETVPNFRYLKKLGLLFQVNLNSLGGYYGKEVQKKALMLARKGMIDFIGSDIHHQKHMEYFKSSFKSNYMEIIFSNNIILNDSI